MHNQLSHLQILLWEPQLFRVQNKLLDFSALFQPKIWMNPYLSCHHWLQEHSQITAQMKHSRFLLVEWAFLPLISGIGMIFLFVCCDNILDWSSISGIASWRKKKLIKRRHTKLVPTLTTAPFHLPGISVSPMSWARTYMFFPVIPEIIVAIYFSSYFTSESLEHLNHGITWQRILNQNNLLNGTDNFIVF